MNLSDNIDTYPLLGKSTNKSCNPCCLRSIIILIFVGIAVSLLVYFLYPRTPLVYFSSAFLQPGGSFIIDVPNQLFFMPLNIELFLFNPNYFSVNLQSTSSGSGYYQSAILGDVLLGTATTYTRTFYRLANMSLTLNVSLMWQVLVLTRFF